MTGQRSCTTTSQAQPGSTWSTTACQSPPPDVVVVSVPGSSGAWAWARTIRPCRLTSQTEPGSGEGVCRVLRYTGTVRRASESAFRHGLRGRHQVRRRRESKPGRGFRLDGVGDSPHPPRETKSLRLVSTARPRSWFNGRQRALRGPGNQLGREREVKCKWKY
ncbi:hypothetical protein LX32DRAFT_54741 [Colletotrichum zoysiae]|uniref:Uncharacterized protein n=1 Tax=Colletotrichum zoysiae TaxID=1216348 RepID=A0AAD9HBX1_9PEZI|nr:hypothetical protein LX32DRAFT_54741 [Colletotrichum zoysiae]